MRVVQFWFSPDFPEAMSAVRRYAPQAEAAWTGPDTWGYWRALRAAWEDTREDLLMIEQDVLIHEDVIPSMEACAEPWCAYENEIGPGGWTPHGLGCTRFSAALRRQVTVQDIMCPAPHRGTGGCQGTYCDNAHPQGSACHNRHHGCPDCGAFCHQHLEGPILDAIEAITGQRDPHIHEPRIRHLHQY